MGLKQTEFEIRQLDNTARILTTHAEAVQAAQKQPALNAAVASTLTRADTQIAIASFSNENVAGEAKRLASLCNANIKEKSITDDIVLASTFNFNYDKNVFSKALNFPGGLTVRYGNVQGKETGYIPFVSTVNNRNIKILATSVEALQGFFQG